MLNRPFNLKSNREILSDINHLVDFERFSNDKNVIPIVNKLFKYRDIYLYFVKISAKYVSKPTIIS